MRPSIEVPLVSNPRPPVVLYLSFGGAHKNRTVSSDQVVRAVPVVNNGGVDHCGKVQGINRWIPGASMV